MRGDGIGQMKRRDAPTEITPHSRFLQAFMPILQGFYEKLRSIIVTISAKSLY
jgi:hypothetical protein